MFFISILYTKKLLKLRQDNLKNYTKEIFLILKCLINNLIKIFSTKNANNIRLNTIFLLLFISNTLESQNVEKKIIRPK